MNQSNNELRTLPLPRLAGRLTYMRSKMLEISELTIEHLAIMGIPYENTDEELKGYQYSPLAIRETSVYYGWFSNPQFKSAPIDIVTRKKVDTGCINQRLVDIGDISVTGLNKEQAEKKIYNICKELKKTQSASIILGGDEGIVYSACKGLTGNNKIGFIQLGGVMPSNTDNTVDLSIQRLLNEEIINYSNMMFVSPLTNPTIEFAKEFRSLEGTIVSTSSLRNLKGNYRGLFSNLKNKTEEVVVVLDISALDSSLHGMTEIPKFNGLTLIEIQNLLIAFGQLPIKSLIITGLNPTLNGLGIVKTGQRMLVTALLKFIYSRLGLLRKDEVIR